MSFESVLAILIPEAEALVGPFRSKYDSSAAQGMPAHITINYPFLGGEFHESEAVNSLRQLFSLHKRFEFSLVSAKRFPGVLYLEPSPSRPFVDLIQAVAMEFPESPPYGGVFGGVVPHLTVATSESRETMDEICRQFDLACEGKLPIRATATEIWLLDNRDGAWNRRASFALAGRR